MNIDMLPSAVKTEVVSYSEVVYDLLRCSEAKKFEADLKTKENEDQIDDVKDEENEDQDGDVKAIDAEEPENLNMDVDQNRQLSGGKGKHGCKICDRKFSDMSSLKAHAYVHRSDKNTKCKICSAAIATCCSVKPRATRQVRRSNYKENFECLYCGEIFSLKGVRPKPWVQPKRVSTRKGEVTYFGDFFVRSYKSRNAFVKLVG